MSQTDILVSGGGIAGLAAAAAFGAAGFSVLCVDPAPPVTTPDTPGSDQRSTALLQPARVFLEEAGIWERLAPHAAPLHTMRLMDAGGPEAEARLTCDFNASDLSELPFGWNVPNWLLRREFLAALDQVPNVEFRAGTSSQDYLARDREARVRLNDGSQVRARLVIAADGRNSALRAAAGIGVQTTRYGQKALAFSVTHPIPHQGVSTEIHRSGGPFTLVPLPDREGLPASAVVWMEHGPRAQDLADMDKTTFEAEMTARSCNVLGPLTLASKRSLWPIITQRATALTAQRLALVAEAAHVVPPIGAQGLNMSFADLRALLELAQARPGDLGDARMLDAYARARRADITVRQTGIDALNRAAMTTSQPLRDARAMALNTLHKFGPVRRGLMQLGLGLRG